MSSMKVVAYRLDGQDNQSVMFKDSEAKPLCPVSTSLLLPNERKALYDNTARDSDIPSTCPTCGWRLDFQAHNPKYKLRSTKRDISATYDGQLIVSKQFRDFCQQEGINGARFLPFINDENHFHLVVDRIVPFVVSEQSPKFYKYCSTCKIYGDIILASKVYISTTVPLLDGFYRTDLVFASGNEKHPLVLVGTDTKSKLKAVGLKGLEFEPAFGIE